LPRSTLFPYTTLFRSTPAHGLRNGPEVPSKPGPKVPGAGIAVITEGRAVAHSRPSLGSLPSGSLRNKERHSTIARSTACPGPLRSEEHTSELQSRENL